MSKFSAARTREFENLRRLLGWATCWGAILCVARSNAVSDEKFWESKHFVMSCTVVDGKMKFFHVFPGGLCQFFDDGTFVSVSESGIIKYDSKTQVLWKLQGQFHHQLNLTGDRKHLLALASEYALDQGKKVRYDVFLKISVADGSVEKKLSARSFLKRKNPSELPPVKWITADPNTVEASHFNSFHEIPKISGNPLPGFEEGNFILNSFEDAFYVVDRDLSRVLYRAAAPASMWHHVHDAQVTPQGNVIYFNNQNQDGTPRKYSSVDLFDPRRKKRILSFSATPKEMFNSPLCGGVQVLENGLWLVSDWQKGVFIVDPVRNAVRYANIDLVVNAYNGWQPALVQEIKLVDLTKFLSKWTF